MGKRKLSSKALKKFTKVYNTNETQNIWTDPDDRNDAEFVRKNILEAHNNEPSKFITTHCKKGFALRETRYMAGHSTVKGRRRLVSGLVRASVKEETRKLINEGEHGED